MLLDLFHMLRFVHGQGGWANVRYEWWRRFGRCQRAVSARDNASAETPSIEHAGAGERVAIVLHVHYEELWPEIRNRLRRMPVPFDLYVTLTESRGWRVEADLRRSFPGARVEVVPDRGRDALGFHRLLTGPLSTGRYDLICKLHSKKSVHSRQGDAWRRDLLDGVLGSPPQILGILRRFRTQPRLGMVAASSCFASSSMYSEASSTLRIRRLAAAIGYNDIPDDFAFVAGTMFWVRADALAALRTLVLADHDFEVESGQTGDLMAHAYERFLGLQIQMNGYEYASIPTGTIRPFWLNKAHRHLQLRP